MRTVYSAQHYLRAASELIGGQIKPSYECPERVEIILNRIKEVNLGDVIKPQSFELNHIHAIHDIEYINFLQNCWDDWVAEGNQGELLPVIWPGRSMPSLKCPQHIDGKAGYYCLAADTSITADTWQAVKAAADVAITASMLINNGEAAAFALTRPPGHHATADAYGGYCFINNAAISAQYLLDHGAARVAILDVDFHHGNGTQSIFYERADVLVQSIHGEPSQSFPYFSGYADECGLGEGVGFNINYPLPPGTLYESWQLELQNALGEISEYSPDALLVSLGVDTFEHDPISSFKLKSADFSDLGKRIGGLNLPTVFMMEGGYAVKQIGINTINVLSGFEHAQNLTNQTV
jgi:acetoin utilization deacetylase AcuC-like enzyme